MKSKPIDQLRDLHIHGHPLRLLLNVGMSYGADISTDLLLVQPVDEISIRAAHPEEREDKATPTAICWSCEAMNVTVLLRNDEEIETHRKIHEAIVGQERYRK